MGKKEQTIYTCDRCGAVISGYSPTVIGRHSFMNVLKWWMPIECQYKLVYLCKFCTDKYLLFLEGGEVNG